MLRKLLLALGAIVLVAACAAPGKTTATPGGSGAFFSLEAFQAPPGRLADLASHHGGQVAPALETTFGAAVLGYWTPVDSTDARLIRIVAYPSLESHAAMLLSGAVADAGQPEETRLIAMPHGWTTLQLTDYSPPLDPSPSPQQRVFELRTYTAAPGRLADLHARFRDHTLALFAKHGIENIAYFEVAGGEKAADTMLYLVAFPSLEARAASWAAFLADPEWRAVAAASEAEGPMLAQGGIETLILQPTEYSPLK